jgi:hypothetical protein
MLEPLWQGRAIRVFRRAVMHELVELGMDLWDIVEILEKGFECGRGVRKKGIVERCIRKGRKIVKVVVEEGEELLDEKRVDIWVLRHVGKFSEKEGRW